MRPLHSIARLMFYRVRTISVRDCVHYCGFRYGRGDFNPYEDYIRGIIAGTPLGFLRERLRDFLVHYRPSNLAEALSLDLNSAPPLWHLPWNRIHSGTPRGWRDTADEIPDVLTHFSHEGVPERRIHDEHGWLDGAWSSISAAGYRPEQYSYIRVFQLQGEERSAYIVADGNHRIACLAAQNVDQVKVILAPIRIARRAQSWNWPGVRGGGVSESDALKIFDAYFHGNQEPFRAAIPAAISTLHQTPPLA